MIENVSNFRLILLNVSTVSTVSNANSHIYIKCEGVYGYVDGYIYIFISIWKISEKSGNTGNSPINTDFLVVTQLVT